MLSSQNHRPPSPLEHWLAHASWTQPNRRQGLPPSLRLGLPRGHRGPNTAAPQELTHSHSICAAASSSSSSQPLAVFSSSCYTGRGGTRSHHGREQNNFSLKCSLSTSESLGTTPQHKCIPDLHVCLTLIVLLIPQLGLWVNHSMIQTVGQINFQVLLSNNNQKEGGTGIKRKTAQVCY